MTGSVLTWTIYQWNKNTRLCFCKFCLLLGLEELTRKKTESRSWTQSWAMWWKKIGQHRGIGSAYATFSLFLPSLSLSTILSHSPGWRRTHCRPARFKPTVIFLSGPTASWNSRCALPHPALISRKKLGRAIWEYDCDSHRGGDKPGGALSTGRGYNITVALADVVSTNTHRNAFVPRISKTIKKWMSKDAKPKIWQLTPSGTPRSACLILSQLRVMWFI